MKIRFEGGELDGDVVEIPDMVRGAPDHILSEAGIYSPAGHTDDGVWIYALDTEIDDYFRKPHAVDALLNAVLDDILNDLRRHEAQRRAELN